MHLHLFVRNHQEEHPDVFAGLHHIVAICNHMTTHICSGENCSIATEEEGLKFFILLH